MGITGRPVGLIDFGAVQTGLSDSPFRVGQYSDFGAWPSIGITVQGTTGRISVFESVDFHPSPPIAPTVPPLTTDAADTGFTAVPYWRSSCAQPAAAEDQREREGLFGVTVSWWLLLEEGMTEAGQWGQGSASRLGRTQAMIVICVSGAVSVFVRGPPRPRPKLIWTLSQYLPGGTA